VVVVAAVVATAARDVLGAVVLGLTEVVEARAASAAAL
jgi:hypothetical protein